MEQWESFSAGLFCWLKGEALNGGDDLKGRRRNATRDS